MFNVKYNIYDNKVYINSDYNNEVIILLYKWDTTNNNNNLLYKFDPIKFENNTIFFEITNLNLYDFNGIKVEIVENNNIIFEEYIRFRNRYGDIIKKQAIHVLSMTGFGDTLTCTPVIRKLYQVYNQKITIFTFLPEVFINNPYVEEVIKIDLSFKKEDYNNIYDIYEAFNAKKSNYAALDLRQLNAFNIGFQLKEHELDMEFFPDPYIEIPKLPDKFICINPSITYTDRTWNIENWQTFINLIEKHIPVVAIGKITYYDDVCPKTFHPVIIKNGLNLLNNKYSNTLSQMYHIINKSETFVTMANGLHMLAISSDAHITQIGSPWDTEWYRTRKCIKNYKTDYILGKCKLHCTSNMKLSVDEHKTHMFPLYVHHNTIFSDEAKEKFKDRWWNSEQCYIGNQKYECQPDPYDVYKSVLNLIKNK